MALLVVQVGRRIEDEIRNHFPDEKDPVFLPCINQMKFDGPDLEKLVTGFERQLEKLANDGAAPLKIVLSGPVVVSFILGMAAGARRSNVRLYHLDMTGNREEYIRVGMPTGWRETK